MHRKLLFTSAHEWNHVNASLHVLPTPYILIFYSQEVKSFAASEPAAAPASSSPTAVSPPPPSARLPVVPQRLRTTSPPPPHSTSEPPPAVFFGGPIPSETAATAAAHRPPGIQHLAEVWSMKGFLSISGCVMIYSRNRL